MEIDIVRIEWVDSVAHFGWNQPVEIEDIINNPLSPKYSVGFLLHNDDDHISIAESIGTGNIHNIINIPKKAIIDMVIVSTQEIDTETFRSLRG